MVDQDLEVYCRLDGCLHHGLIDACCIHAILGNEQRMLPYQAPDAEDLVTRVKALGATELVEYV